MTATHSARSANPATRVASSASVPRTIETILLASDLGVASTEATDVAIEMAARMGARLLILNVLDTRRILGGGRHDRLDQARAEREGLLVALVKRARAAGLSAALLLRPGWRGPAPPACPPSSSSGRDRPRRPSARRPRRRAPISSSSARTAAIAPA